MRGRLSAKCVFLLCISMENERIRNWLSAYIGLDLVESGDWRGAWGSSCKTSSGYCFDYALLRYCLD
jgi:hypothetical protein